MKLLRKFFKKEDNKVLIFDILIILLILALPYYIFEGKLFIGGDETRLQYIYPIEWISRIYFYSWYGFNPVGFFNSLQFAIPFLSVFSVINKIIPSDTVINYIAFSSPLILGYIFSKKFFLELKLDIDKWVATIGALFYIFSPILIYKIYNPFLFATWLISFIPIISYLFIRYFRTGKVVYILISVILSIFFAIVFVSIPWILGFMLPLLLVFPLAIFLFGKKLTLLFLKRSFIFFGLILLSQSFWTFSYLYSFFGGAGYITTVLSDTVSNTFSSTVNATSTGLNIIYPVTNLFHREIAFLSEWPLKYIFLDFYDHIFFINIIYVVVLIIGLFYADKIISYENKRIYILSFFLFLISLFLFTVNIGPLKEVFLWLGNIPGFVMFRNFYGKFSIAYVIYFSIFFTFSLNIFLKQFPRYKNIIIGLLLILIFVNVIPIKKMINVPLWKTENVYLTSKLPGEYLDFMSNVEETVPSTTSILSLPINIASYSIVKEDNSNNIFAGSSPIKLLTDIPAFSGDLSFSSIHAKSEQVDMNKWIQERDYKKINEYLNIYNINYVIETKNIPQQVKDSYLFHFKTIANQDSELVNAITEEKVLESNKGNYILYKTKNNMTLINSNNLTYQRINPIKYKLHIAGISKKQDLFFLNTFNSGWKLFLDKNLGSGGCREQIRYEELNTTYCLTESTLFELEDILFSFKENIFDDSHSLHDDYANQWVIDPEYILKNYDESFYRRNPDGSIDIELILYFVPQNYFYFGSIISIVVILFVIILTIKHRKK